MPVDIGTSVCMIKDVFRIPSLSNFFSSFKHSAFCLTENNIMHGCRIGNYHGLYGSEASLLITDAAVRDYDIYPQHHQ